ncbi:MULTISPECIES: hypothetical protein [Alphaproteobacteria]|nr:MULTISPECIES: hypothetical protein [Alphaproteobacteria]MAN88741.1 hypothetical protein [Algoriphagus sp.]
MTGALTAIRSSTTYRQPGQQRRDGPAKRRLPRDYGRFDTVEIHDDGPGSVTWDALNGTVPGWGTMGVVGLIAFAAMPLALLSSTPNGKENANMRSVWICSGNDVIANLAVWRPGSAFSAPERDGSTSSWRHWRSKERHDRPTGYVRVPE